MRKQNTINIDLDGMSKPILFREMEPPINPRRIPSIAAESKEFIFSDNVIEFLEAHTVMLEFDYIGYEVRTVDYISGVFLMINPDPRNLAHVPENSLVISHHKISTHNNRIYAEMLDLAKRTGFNIYNFHLAWDIMEGGIRDSFLSNFGLTTHEYENIDLTYRSVLIPQLGAIFKRRMSIEEITTKLILMNVRPTVIINPQCKTSTIGYIPGGGFVDNMVIEMADYGVDVLISSDHNWVVETVARELGMTLIEIDHYQSERHGLTTMKTLLESSFPKTPINILENMHDMQHASCDCEF
ncbi:MAG: Nif3-like dinuclear metal center hexameric protein [Candidatus Thorarchaeota archaeon]